MHTLAESLAPIKTTPVRGLDSEVHYLELEIVDLVFEYLSYVRYLPFTDNFTDHFDEVDALPCHTMSQVRGTDLRRSVALGRLQPHRVPRRDMSGVSGSDATIRTGFQPEPARGDRARVLGPGMEHGVAGEQERQEPRDRTLWLVTVGRVATAVAGVIALIRMLILR